MEIFSLRVDCDGLRYTGIIVRMRRHHLLALMATLLVVCLTAAGCGVGATQSRTGTSGADKSPEKDDSRLTTGGFQESTSASGRRSDGRSVKQARTTGRRPLSEARETGAGKSVTVRHSRGTGGLAARIRAIAGSYPAAYGVVVLQPGSGKEVSLDTDRRFEAASIAKLPVLLALYRDAATGRVDLDERISLQSSDLQPGTGVLQYRQLGTTLTLRQCAWYMISESDNTAWAMLGRYLGYRRIRAELEHVGATSTHYEYAKNTTTPQDVLAMLEHISDPGYTSPALSGEMLSAMTDTSFEGWLPEGVPPDARVAHKIGLMGESFGDAGVIYPKAEAEDRYYMVVLSEGTDESSSRAAMAEMSAAAYHSLVNSAATPRAGGGTPTP